MTIEDIKRNILINESINKGIEKCGLKVVEVIEKHYKNLSEDFITDIENIFLK